MTPVHEHSSRRSNSTERNRDPRRRISPVAALIVAVLVIALLTLILWLIHGTWFPGSGPSWF
jgi:polyferredoxin